MQVIPQIITDVIRMFKLQKRTFDEALKKSIKKKKNKIAISKRNKKVYILWF